MTLESRQSIPAVVREGAVLALKMLKGDQECQYPLEAGEASKTISV